MGWLDHQEKVQKDNNSVKSKCNFPIVEVKLPGGTDFVPVNRNCVERVFEDTMKPVFLIIDEAAELLGSEKGSSEAVKEENAIKGEIEAIIQSITQLGRSSGMHLIIATQRNSTNIISGTIQANCIGTNTPPVMEE